MRENLGYKLLALLLATLLWVKVASDRNPSVTKTVEDVPVRYHGLRSGYMIADAPSTVSVNVTGPQSVLRLLGSSKLKASVNLSGIEPGVHTLKAQIDLPADVREQVKHAASDVTLTVEAFKRKSSAVDVSFEGAPPLGKRFGKAIADPSAAVYSGRSSLVDRVRRLNVTITAGAAESEVADYYPVKALDETGREIEGLKIEPSRVAVTLQLEDAPATKHVIVSPTIVGSRRFRSGLRRSPYLLRPSRYSARRRVSPEQAR